MLFAFSIITALSAVYAKNGSKVVGGAVIAMLFIFFGFYDIAFTPLSFAYPIEILPYRLRSRGMSVTLTTVFAAGVSLLILPSMFSFSLSNSTNMFQMLNQYLNPVALAALAWRYYFVYIGCLISFVAIIWFLFPETKGRSLEEIAEVFDGPAAETEAHRQASIATIEGLKGGVDTVSETEFREKA